MRLHTRWYRTNIRDLIRDFVRHNHFIQHLFYFLRCQGAQLSHESGNIYAKRNESNENAIKTLFYGMLCTTVGTFLVPFCCPLCFALFGFPSPKWWYIPIHTDQLWVWQLESLYVHIKNTFIQIFLITYALGCYLIRAQWLDSWLRYYSNCTASVFTSAFQCHLLFCITVCALIYQRALRIWHRSFMESI